MAGQTEYLIAYRFMGKNALGGVEMVRVLASSKEEAMRKLVTYMEYDEAPDDDPNWDFNYAFKLYYDGKWENYWKDLEYEISVKELREVYLQK